MNDSHFADQVRTAQARVAALRERARLAAGDETTDLLAEGLEELSVAFEELHVAQEELQVRTESLAESTAAAAAERDLYQDLFEFAPNGYVTTDGGGVVQKANRAAVALLACMPRALVGKPLTIFVWSGDRGPFLHWLAALHKGEPTWERTIRFQPRGENSPPRTVDVTVVPFREPGSRRALLRWQLRDVTDRNQAAEDLRRLNAELEERVRARTLELETMLDEKEAAEGRLAFLSASGALFASSLDVDEALAHIDGRVVPTLGDACFVELVDEDGLWQVHPLSLRRGRPRR